jgi:hypothetical protein
MRESTLRMGILEGCIITPHARRQSIGAGMVDSAEGLIRREGLPSSEIMSLFDLS